MIPKPKKKTKKKTLKRKNAQFSNSKPAQKSKLISKKSVSASKEPIRSSIKCQFHPVPKPGHRPGEPISVINRVSQRQREREHYLRILKLFLITHRAGGCCEIPYCGGGRNLQAAHIVERSEGGKDTAGNIIIACEIDHDHQKYVHGLPLPQEDLLRLIADKNIKHGISNFLTGDRIPNGGEIEY